jgi:thiosulfate reductase/polysulfide reductase chain A
MDLPELVFEKIEDIWGFQLEGTGVTIGDFDATGMVSLVDNPVYKAFEDLSFKTPSKKIEMGSSHLTDNGVVSLAPYKSPTAAEQGSFRLTFGRCALHTQGHTVNNPLLSEQMSENHLWIHVDEAEKLGIRKGDRVMVSRNGYSESITANVTETIHPEAVFVVHGFGHRLPLETRAFNKGLADNRFMTGGLDIWDRAGGAIAYQEHFVTVEKA